MALFGKKKNDELDEDVDTLKGRSPTPAPGQTRAISEPKRTKPSKKADRPNKSLDGQTPSGEEKSVGSIGKSIVVKGELTGNEDVEIDGTVDGDIRLPEHVLTIGPNGKVGGSIHAKTIQILGNVKGDVSASERIEIESSGVVEGDLRSPRLLVQEGAVFNGSIEMTGGPSSQTSRPQTTEDAATQKSVQAV